MDDWLVWLGAAVVLALLELLSLDLVLLMLAVGALGGMVVALTSSNLVIEVVVALVVATGMLALVRPELVRRLHHGPELRIGPDRLLGLRASAEEIISSEHPGQVIIGGEQWTAKPYDEQLVIEPGTTVEVLQIRGATAYVHPAD